MMFFMVMSFLVLGIALWNRSEFKRKEEYIYQVGTQKEIAQFPKFNLLVGFICVFIFHWLPYVILRLLEQINLQYRTSQVWAVLSYAQMVSFTTQGISSAIVWHFSRAIRVKDHERQLFLPGRTESGELQGLHFDQSDPYSYDEPKVSIQ